MNFALKTPSLTQRLPVKTAIAFAIALVVTPATAQTGVDVVGDVEQGVYDARQVQSQARGIAYSLQRGGIGGAVDAASGVLNILGNKSVQKAAGTVVEGNRTGAAVQDAQAGLYDVRSVQAGVDSVNSALQRGGIGGAMDAASGVFNIFGNRSVQKAAGAVVGGNQTATGAVQDAQTGLYDARNVQAHVGGVSSALQRGGINGALDAASSAMAILGNRSVQNAAGAVAGQAAAGSVSQYAPQPLPANQPVFQSQPYADLSMRETAYPVQAQSVQTVALPSPAPTPTLLQGGCAEVVASVIPQAQAAPVHAAQAGDVRPQYVAIRAVPNPEHMRLQEMNRRAMGLE